MRPNGLLGRRGSRLLLGALFLGLPAASARADAAFGPEPPPTATVAPAAGQPEAVPDRRTLGKLPLNLVRGTVGVFHLDSLKVAVVGGGAAGIASIWDDDVRSSLANPDSSFGKTLETAGGWPTSVLVVGLFTAGELGHQTRLRAMGYDMVDASIVNLGYTSLLKVAVGRERPDGSNNASFPSGHASNAFTLATVAELHYGWAVGVPAYAVAATIGASRIVRDKHYLSDVVAGATLGVIVGRAVVRVNGRPPGNAARTAVLRVSPVIGVDERGVQLALSF